MARDFVRHIQQLRKDNDLEIENRIQISYWSDDSDVLKAVETWADYINNETLADSISLSDSKPADGKEVSVGSANVQIGLQKS